MGGWVGAGGQIRHGYGNFSIAPGGAQCFDGVKVIGSDQGQI